MESSRVPPPNARASRLRLRISAAAEKQLRAGHPWVFSDSVREQNRAGRSGELAVIFDRHDRFLAVGFHDPESPIRFRALHVGSPLTIDLAFWRSRLEQALQRRSGLFDAQTNGYRLINGESDGWPGLVLDRYDSTLVVKAYTAAWRQGLAELTPLICEFTKPRALVLRLSRNLQNTGPPEASPPPREASPTRCGDFPSAREQLQPWKDGAVLFSVGEADVGRPVTFRESGLVFEADVCQGQKTGFFLDQRENRRRVAELAQGRRVLNAFSFSGGFSVYAARGGAKSVTDLDISKHALATAERNFKRNAGDPNVAACRREGVQADAFPWLAGNANRMFDLIVLDPPSLAKREVERRGAIRAYGALAADALRHLAPRGILVACSCSAHVSAEEFFGAVRMAVRNSGGRFTEWLTTRHAPDHPATFKEAEYLKAIYFRRA